MMRSLAYEGSLSNSSIVAGETYRQRQRRLIRHRRLPVLFSTASAHSSNRNESNRGAVQTWNLRGSQLALQ